MLGTACELLGCSKIALLQDSFQLPDLQGIQLEIPPARKLARQRHWPEANSHQTAHNNIDGFHDAAHFAITALTNHDPIPAIGALATNILTAQHLSRSVFELDTVNQTLFLFIVNPPEHTHSVLTLPAVTRMHQLVRKLTRGAEHQQALGVVIQTPDRNPACAL